MKTGKASGMDRILNEFLKAGKIILVKPIAKMFNDIWSSGKYPKLWSTNTLSTIHKGGPKDNLDNYRGISVGSCFGKLFGALLSSRMEKTMNEFDLIGPNQIGFLKGHRTSDHVYVVNTLVNRIVKQRGKSIFTAFIDLRKAYDSVDRYFLFNKLWALGFNGNFFESLKSIYKSVYTN